MRHDGRVGVRHDGRVGVREVGCGRPSPCAPGYRGAVHEPATAPPDGRRREPTTLLRAAVRPQMLVLLVVLLGAAAVCARLGVWQLDRAEIRGDRAQAERVAEQEAAPPVPLTDVLAPQTTFAGDLVGRRVVVEGVYDSAGELLVAERAVGSQVGYLVLTPLRVAGTQPTAVLPVVRGWAATPQEAAAVPAPAGSVEVVGFLQGSEGAGAGIADGRTDAISSAELLNVWGGPIWTGYLVLDESDPAQADGLTALPPPTTQGTGLNIQNLAYAAQWWIFGGFALLLWTRLVRDEARGDVDDGGGPGEGAEVSAPVGDAASP